jgi:hypothetical protein
MDSVKVHFSREQVFMRCLATQTIFHGSRKTRYALRLFAYSTRFKQTV